MPNQKVTLIRYCRVDEGERSVWKRYPVAIGKNGKIRPDYVIVKAQHVHCPIGHYELRFYEGRKLRYENVGNNAQTAWTKKLAKEKLLTAKNAASDAGVTLPEIPGRVYLRRAAGLYVDDRKNNQALEAARDAEQVTGEFIADCGKTFLDEVTKEDILHYHKTLRKQGQSERTIANKHQRLRSFFKFAGLNVNAMMPAKPKYEKSLPTVYTAQEVGALLNAADDYMRLVIEFGLKCGLRELEIVYLEWSDIHWQDKVLRVQGKAHWEFKVKDSEQRDVPIPDDLIEHLEEWKKTHGKNRLILGTENDKPNMHMLRQLKRLVNRAGLNCKHCEGCTGNIKECADWTLHKLRRTYTTTLLRNGVDVRTAMQFTGHSDLASVMRYLRPAGTKETQQKINAIQFAAEEKKIA
jgi:integrase